jgi:proline dehydrogenase
MNSVKRLQKSFLERQTGTIACYVVEGLRQVENSTLDTFCSFTERSIRQMVGTQESHFALKLTAYLSTELMEKLSAAQQSFVHEILEVVYDANDSKCLTEEKLRANLAKRGITDYTEEDFSRLVRSVSDEHGKMTNTHRYFGGHVYSLYSEPSPLMRQICAKLGALTDKDFKNADLFAGRIKRIAEEAERSNCKLYVDAEQTFLQAAIESFGQQLTHKLNQGTRTVIMNGYQCYLKRTLKIIPLEVSASKTIGFNLGIKLIRGAYMNEERMIAERNGTESPVWNTIEGTHNCYNTNMELIISQMKSTDTLFVASHNVDSVEKAVSLATTHNRQDSVLFGQL